MSFISDTFFGGAEREAGRRQEAAAISGSGARVQGLESAIDTLTPWAEGGTSAFQMQLAQSGALGPEAQQEFYDNFNTSPGTQFRLDQSRRFVESGGDEFGGSGGGNRLRRLQEIGLGLIQQDLTTQFNQLGTLSQSGYGATGDIARLRAGIGDARGRGIEGSAAGAASGILGSAGAIRGTARDLAMIGGAGGFNFNPVTSTTQTYV